MSQKKVVLLLTSDFPPSKTSAAALMMDLANEFVRQGCNVVVLAPTSLVYNVRDDFGCNEITVKNFFAPQPRVNSYLLRTLYEFLIPFFLLKGVGLRYFSTLRVDYIIWYSPTIFFGMLVLFLKKKYKCGAYLVLRDIFPDWAVDLGIIRKGFAYHILKAFAAVQYFAADRIGVQSASNVKFLDAWKSKVEVLHNWMTPPVRFHFDLKKIDKRLCGKKVIIFIGNMGIAQNLMNFIEVLRGFSNMDDLFFVFLGRGTQYDVLCKTCAENDLKNIVFHPEVDNIAIPSILDQCAAGIVCLDPRHKTHNIPGKFLSYLDAGLPVFAFVGRETDLAKIIESEAVGLVFPDTDYTKCYNEITRLLSDKEALSAIKINSRALLQKKFSTSETVKKLLRYI